MDKDADSISSMIKHTILSILTIVLILNINMLKTNATTIKKTTKEETRTKINLFSNLYDVITGTIVAYEVVSNENILGYINSEISFEGIKNSLEEKYALEENINKNLILSFEIDGDINIRESRVVPDNIITEEEISNKIYELSKNEVSNIKFKVKYLKEKDIEINPSTIIMPTEDMFLGESRTVSGESGLKKQILEVTSENNTVTSEKIVKENVIKNEVSRVIYRGTKNPYDYGVAFLKQPTRGGYLTSAYGERWNSFHKGIDIAGNIGDDVFVALNGEIIYAQFNDGGYGNLIIVEHEDDMKTYYAHLDDFYVKVGDKVKKGDVIGALGNTGFSTGPHLHFELRVDDKPVDPYSYIVQ